MFAGCFGRFIFPSQPSLILGRTIAARSTSTKSFISPLLLKRARSIAEQHAKLSTQNAEDYNIATAKKIGELSTVTAALAEWDTANNVIASSWLHTRALY